MAVTEKDRDSLARTLWGEARGESLVGRADERLLHEAPGRGALTGDFFRLALSPPPVNTVSELTQP